MLARNHQPSLFQVSRILHSTTGTARLVKSFIIFLTLATLDLFGVLLFGYIGSVVLNGINPNLNSLTLNFLPEFLKLDSANLQTRVLLLTLSAIGILSLRSVASLYFTKRNLAFLGKKAAHTSGELVRSVLKGNTKRASDIATDLYTVTTGVQQLYTSVVGNLLAALADILLSLTFIVGIMFVDFLTSLMVTFAFIVFALITNVFLSKRVKENGMKVGKISRRSQQEVIDAIALHREIRLRGITDQVAERITQERIKLADVLVPNQIYAILNKYLIEAFLLVLLSSVAGMLFFLYDANTGFAKLAIFFVASSRIAPALIRMQNSILQASSNMNQAFMTLEAISDLKVHEKNANSIRSKEVFFDSGTLNIDNPVIKVTNLKYQHKIDSHKEKKWELNVPNLELTIGDVLSITGSSGSGKSTFVDLLLAFKEPTHGNITFCGKSIDETLEYNKGILGYVPQEVFLHHGTLRENVTLFDQSYEGMDNSIWEVLRLVGLEEWVINLPAGLDSKIGHGVLAPSGGQKQRIGLARCLLSRPKLIVLDEVTSGLDPQTEEDLLNSMKLIPWDNIQIWVTHRDTVNNQATVKMRIETDGSSDVVYSK